MCGKVVYVWSVCGVCLLLWTPVSGNIHTGGEGVVAGGGEWLQGEGEVVAYFLGRAPPPGAKPLAPSPYDVDLVMSP